MRRADVMVIHTIINEYDLLYAQEREADYAVDAAKDDKGGCITALSAGYTKLPEYKDNGGYFYDSN